MDRREPHVLVGHRLDVVQEDHRDVGDRRGDALQAGLCLQPVELLVGDVEDDLALAGIDLGDAARRVRHELDDDRLVGRRAAPIAIVRGELQEGVLLELHDLVGAGADGRRLETLRRRPSRSRPSAARSRSESPST